MPDVNTNNGKQLLELCDLIKFLKSQPGVLHQPELQIMKAYIESLGEVVPEKHMQSEIFKSYPVICESLAAPEPAEDGSKPETVESDVGLDMEGVIGKFKQLFLIELE